MTELEFDSTLSTAENIEMFFQYLEGVNKEMATLLKDNIEKLVPLPTENAPRTMARSAFNKAVLNSIMNESIEKVNNSNDPESE